MLNFFAVFGNPITHSKSPILHNYALLRAMQDLHKKPKEGKVYPLYGCYGRILLTDSKELRKKFDIHTLSGANITLPFKEEAFAQCDEVRGIAREIGACNTWVREKNGIVVGYNTDAEGFYACIAGLTINNALILGAGGSARAVAMILRAHGIGVSLLNRSQKRLNFFRDHGFECYESENFEPSCSYDLIINTTSAGLNNDFLPCEKGKLEAMFADACYAFDLIYGMPTPFLTLAKAYGLNVSDGKDMLIYQAALALELFCKDIPLMQEATYTQLVSYMREIFV